MTAFTHGIRQPFGGRCGDCLTLAGGCNSISGAVTKPKTNNKAITAAAVLKQIEGVS